MEKDEKEKQIDRIAKLIVDISSTIDEIKEEN